MGATRRLEAQAPGDLTDAVGAVPLRIRLAVPSALARASTAWAKPSKRGIYPLQHDAPPVGATTVARAAPHGSHQPDSSPITLMPSGRSGPFSWDDVGSGHGAGRVRVEPQRIGAVGEFVHGQPQLRKGRGDLAQASGLEDQRVERAGK